MAVVVVGNIILALLPIVIATHCQLSARRERKRENKKADWKKVGTSDEKSFQKK